MLYWQRENNVSKPMKTLVLAAVMMATMSAVSLNAGAVEPDHDAQARAYFSDTDLVSHRGEKLRFYSDVLRDKVVLINVMYASCEDACPLLTSKLTALRDNLGSLFGDKVFFVSITSDPDKDDPAALAKFAKMQKADDQGWRFLTGEPDLVRNVLKKLGQLSSNPEGHSTILIAGNVRTKHWKRMKPEEPMFSLAEKLRALAAEG